MGLSLQVTIQFTESSYVDLFPDPSPTCVDTETPTDKSLSLLQLDRLS